MQQVPPTGSHIFSLDDSDWPHPQAKVLADRQYVHAASKAINGGDIVVGHPYSVLAWVPEAHGGRFAFKEAETWPETTESVEFEDARWGQVRLRRWDNLHAKQDAQTVFSVILAETHRERAKPAKPFWLGFQYPTTDTPDEPPLKELWADYHYRWPVEPGIRFRKPGFSVRLAPRQPHRKRAESLPAGLWDAHARRQHVTPLSERRLASHKQRPSSTKRDC